MPWGLVTPQRGASSGVTRVTGRPPQAWSPCHHPTSWAGLVLVGDSLTRSWCLPGPSCGLPLSTAGTAPLLASPATAPGLPDPGLRRRTRRPRVPTGWPQLLPVPLPLSPRTSCPTAGQHLTLLAPRPPRCWRDCGLPRGDPTCTTSSVAHGGSASRGSRHPNVWQDSDMVAGVPGVTRHAGGSAGRHGS